MESTNRVPADARIRADLIGGRANRSGPRSRRRWAEDRLCDLRREVRQPAGHVEELADRDPPAVRNPADEIAVVKAVIYVDGFNLYYGCLKGTPYRWLDLQAFAQKMLPRDEIAGIKYFTAIVDARPGKEHAPARSGDLPPSPAHPAQSLYLRGAVPPVGGGGGGGGGGGACSRYLERWRSEGARRVRTKPTRQAGQHIQACARTAATRCRPRRFHGARFTSPSAPVCFRAASFPRSSATGTARVGNPPTGRGPWNAQGPPEGGPASPRRNREGI